MQALTVVTWLSWLGLVASLAGCGSTDDDSDSNPAAGGADNGAGAATSGGGGSGATGGDVTTPATQSYDADDPKLQYMGRIDWIKPKAPHFASPGVQLKAKFKGTGATIKIFDENRYGKEVNAWTPDIVGKDFDLKPILEPFAAVKQHLTVVSGLGNRPAESPSVHSIIPGTWLSCVPPPRSTKPNAGISVDQIAARHIGQETPLPSLEIATEERGGSSGCDGIYGCSYSRTISFRT